jgi:hypothetical protein
MDDEAERAPAKPAEEEDGSMQRAEHAERSEAIQH